MGIPLEQLRSMIGPAARASLEAQLLGGARSSGGGPIPEPKKKNPRMRSKRVEVDGIKFASTFEANYYGLLKMQMAAGKIARFHRQVNFDLPGGRRLVVDFMVIYPDGRIEYHETKGYPMEDYEVKRDIVQAMYKIKIIEIHPNRRNNKK